jgi:hypothetical protein
MVGRDRIEVVAGGKTSVRQLVRAADVLVRRLAHRHEHDPLAGGRGPCRAPDHVDDGGHRVQAGDRNAAARLETLSIRMRVCVEEPRQHRTTGKIDTPGCGGGVLEKRRIVADGGYVS